MTKQEDFAQQLRETDRLIADAKGLFGEGSDYLGQLLQDRSKIASEYEAAGSSVLAVCHRYALDNPGNDHVISAGEDVMFDQRMGGECYAYWERVQAGRYHKDDQCRVVTWTEAYTFA